MNDNQIPAVRTEEVWKVFEHDGIAVEAVRGVTLEIERGEFVATVLVGGSVLGSGTGTSKKEAQQAAAAGALERLG